MMSLAELSRLNTPATGKASKNAVHEAMDKGLRLLSILAALRSVEANGSRVNPSSDSAWAAGAHQMEFLISLHRQSAKNLSTNRWTISPRTCFTCLPTTRSLHQGAAAIIFVGLEQHYRL